MDQLYWLHLGFVIFFLSIPFWSLTYLRFGVYLPTVLATIWVIFDGCPLTKIQKGLNDEYFSQILLKPFFPKITREQTTRVTYYILLVVTISAMRKIVR